MPLKPPHSPKLGLQYRPAQSASVRQLPAIHASPSPRARLRCSRQRQGPRSAQSESETLVVAADRAGQPHQLTAIVASLRTIPNRACTRPMRTAEGQSHLKDEEHRSALPPCDASEGAAGTVIVAGGSVAFGNWSVPNPGGRAAPRPAAAPQQQESRSPAGRRPPATQVAAVSAVRPLSKLGWPSLRALGRVSSLSRGTQRDATSMSALPEFPLPAVSTAGTLPLQTSTTRAPRLRRTLPDAGARPPLPYFARERSAPSASLRRPGRRAGDVLTLSSQHASVPPPSPRPHHRRARIRPPTPTTRRARDAHDGFHAALRRMPRPRDSKSLLAPRGPSCRRSPAPRRPFPRRRCWCGAGAVPQ